MLPQLPHSLPHSFRPSFAILFLFLSLPFQTVSAATPNEDLIEFLFQHQQLCGNPFSDAQWVPVLDLCEIKCDEQRELCVENDELRQQCTKLPDACVRFWTSNKSANLRSSSVVIATRSPSQKQPANSSSDGKKTSPMLASPNKARSKKEPKEQGQQQLQKNNPLDRKTMGRRTASERRRSPAQMAPKRPTMPMPRMRTEEKLTKARQEEEGQSQKGTEEKSKARWTLVPVKRKEEGKKRAGNSASGRGPHILQSVIELLREE